MDQQTSQQEYVIDSSKNLSKANLELKLNTEYFPALAQLRRCCYKGLSNISMKDAAQVFINTWLELDSIVRSNLSPALSVQLLKMEGFMLTFFTDNQVRDYSQLMEYGMQYASMIKDSGLHNLTLERTEVMVDTILNPVKIKSVD